MVFPIHPLTDFPLFLVDVTKSLFQIQQSSAFKTRLQGGSWNKHVFGRNGAVQCRVHIFGCGFFLHLKFIIMYCVVRVYCLFERISRVISTREQNFITRAQSTCFWKARVGSRDQAWLVRSTSDWKTLLVCQKALVKSFPNLYSKCKKTFKTVENSRSHLSCKRLKRGQNTCS